jgi:DNA-binding MarR family transcriptional regulator
MGSPSDNPFSALGKAFHEPNRLQILSALAIAPQGLSFRELKERCQLTDGNLSRHIKMLEDAMAVRIEKSFVNAKPRTTVFLTDNGRQSLLSYLETLEKVLHQASAAVGKSESTLPENPKEAQA